jgi:hypothetical protein
MTQLLVAYVRIVEMIASIARMKLLAKFATTTQNSDPMINVSLL